MTHNPVRLSRKRPREGLVLLGFALLTLLLSFGLITLQAPYLLLVLLLVPVNLAALVYPRPLPYAMIGLMTGCGMGVARLEGIDTAAMLQCPP
jgi:hypothetical protein